MSWVLSYQKISIVVNGAYVVSVESYQKISIVVNGAYVVSVESYCWNGYSSLFNWEKSKKIRFEIHPGCEFIIWYCKYTIEDTQVEQSMPLIFLLISSTHNMNSIDSNVNFYVHSTLTTCNQYILYYFVFLWSFYSRSCHECQELHENHYNTWKDVTMASFLNSK